MGNPNINNIKKDFKKGHDERRNLNGAPRKYISEMKSAGYSKREIIDCILVLYSMKLSEVTEISKGKYNGKDCTTLEISCARAILKDASKGDTTNLDMLLKRALGQPDSKTTFDGNIESKRTVIVIQKADLSEDEKTGIPPADKAD